MTKKIEYCSRTGASVSTLGYGTGYTSACDGEPAARIKFNGYVTHVRIQASGTLPNATVRIWRDTDASAIDCGVLVGSSSVPNDEIAANTWVALDTPIRVKAGDAFGISFSAGVTLSTTTGLSNKNLFYENTDKTDDAAWDNESGSVNLRFEVRGEAAQLIAYGDSITGGADGDMTGGLRGWRVVNDGSWYSADYRVQAFNYTEMLRTAMGLRVTAALGTGGEDAAHGLTYWETYVAPYAAHRCTVLMNWGINDLVTSSMTLEQHKAAWDSMLELARGVGIRIVRQEILYLRDGYSYDSQNAAYYNAIVDTWNTAMAAWCATNGVKNVLLTPSWQASWIGASDYIHGSLSGYQAISALVSADGGAQYTDRTRLTEQVRGVDDTYESELLDLVSAFGWDIEELFTRYSASVHDKQAARDAVVDFTRWLGATVK